MVQHLQTTYLASCTIHLKVQKCLNSKLFVHFHFFLGLSQSPVQTTGVELQHGCLLHLDRNMPHCGVMYKISNPVVCIVNWRFFSEITGISKHKSILEIVDSERNPKINSSVREMLYNHRLIAFNISAVLSDKCQQEPMGLSTFYKPSTILGLHVFTAFLACCQVPTTIRGTQHMYWLEIS